MNSNDNVFNNIFESEEDSFIREINENYRKQSSNEVDVFKYVNKSYIYDTVMGQKKKDPDIKFENTEKNIKFENTEKDKTCFGTCGCNIF